MRCAAGLLLPRAAFLAASILAAAHGLEPALPDGKLPAGAPVLRGNRILFHPITSFYINGVNGAYERRFAGGRLGLHVPFYLGRIAIDGEGAESTLGGGLGFDLFRSALPGGIRLSVTAEGIDLRRQEFTGYGGDLDPTFPSSSRWPYDVYHQFLYNATLTLGYRWEDASRRFLADLAFGGGYFGVRMPTVGHDPWVTVGRVQPPLAYRGFLPVARFSLGIPF